MAGVGLGGALGSARFVQWAAVGRCYNRSAVGAHLQSTLSGTARQRRGRLAGGLDGPAAPGVRAASAGLAERRPSRPASAPSIVTSVGVIVNPGRYYRFTEYGGILR